MLLRAFAQVANRLPHTLVIAGHPGWGNIDLQRLTVSLGLTDRVTLLQGITDAELHGWLAAADIYVSCSRYEGFNLPLLEAGATGATVVATDLPVHREVTSGHAYLVAPTVEAVAEGMVCAANDPLSTNLNLNHSPNPLTQRSWQQAADETLAVMERLL